MERGGPRAGDEGLCKPIDLYEHIGGEVIKFFQNPINNFLAI
jgi:hypothetical protein